MFRLNPWVMLVLAAVSDVVYAQSVPVLSPVIAEGEEAVPVGSSTTISRDDLEQHHVSSWADITRLDAGVNFNQGNKSIDMRGLDASRVVVTEDGIPLPWLNDGVRGVQGGVSGVNFDALGGIDIYKGAGANGSNALAGAVDLHSLRPDDVLQQGRRFGSQEKITYSGYDNSLSTDTALAFQLSDRTKLLLQYGHKKGYEVKNKGVVGGYGATRTKANPADNDVYQYGLRLEHSFSSRQQIGLGVSAYRQKTVTDQMSNQGRTYVLGKNDNTDKIKRDRIWLDYHYTDPLSSAWLSQLAAVVYWQQSRLDADMDAVRINHKIQQDSRTLNGYPFGDYKRYNSVDQQSYGVSLKAAGNLAHGISHWAAGLAWDIGTFEQYSAGKDNCGDASTELASVTAAIGAGADAATKVAVARRYLMMRCSFSHTNQQDVPKVKYQNVSAYLRNTFAWGDRLDVTPGLRFDYYLRRPALGGRFALSVGNDLIHDVAHRSGSHFSPSLDVRYRATDALTLYARYTEGFRAPTADELYTRYGSANTYALKGNSALKPETSRGYELGAIWDSATLDASLAVFDQYYKNYIENMVAIDSSSPYYALQKQGRYPMGIYDARNIKKSRIYGIEAKLRWDFISHWYLGGSVAWAVGRDTLHDKYLNSVAPLKAVMNLGYDNSQWGVGLTATLAAKRNNVNDKAHDFKAPGYGVVDLFTYWVPASIKGLRLQAALMNAFDKKYWNALNVPASSSRSVRVDDRYTERGRYVVLSLRYRY